MFVAPVLAGGAPPVLGLRLLVPVSEDLGGHGVQAALARQVLGAAAADPAPPPSLPDGARHGLLLLLLRAGLRLAPLPSTRPLEHHTRDS